MSVTAQVSGLLSITDNLTGSVALQKNLAQSFAGVIQEYAQSQSIGVAPSSLTVPNGTAQFLYIRNLHATNTVTVTWTPSGGASNVVLTLQPGAIILFIEPASGSGITALSVVASGASTPIEYLLVG